MTSRRTSDKPVRIYSYGCKLANPEDAELIRQELQRANDYYNALIEIERRQRAAFREVRALIVPGFNEAEARFEEIKAELQWANDAKRAGDDVVAEKIKALKAESQELGDRVREQTAEFELLIGPAQAAFEARTSKAPDELNAQIDELRRQIGEAKKIKRNPDLASLKRSLAELKKARRKFAPPPNGANGKGALNEQVREQMLVESEWPEAWKAIARADARAVEETKAARAAKKCGSPTSLLVEKAIESARKAKADPHFKRFDGTGRVGGQVDSNIAELIGASSGVIRLATPGERVNRRSRGWSAHLWLGNGHKSIELRPAHHRDLPSDARVTWAWLLVTKMGHEICYDLQLTLEAENLPGRNYEGAQGTVEVRFGWSAIRSDAGDLLGLRVATWNGSDGEAGEIMLPASVVERLNHRESNLRKHSDNHYNDVHRLFCRAVRQWKVTDPERLPKWLTERPEPRHGKERKCYVETMHLWKRHETLARVASRWVDERIGRERIKELWRAWRVHRDRTERLPGQNWREWNTEKRKRGLDYFAPLNHITRWLRTQGVTDTVDLFVLYLEWWRRKEEHLVWWGAHETARAAGHRRQIYRSAAIELRRRYEFVDIDSMKLSATAKKRGPRDRAPNPLDSRMRSQQRDAAPSELRHDLLEVFGPNARLKKLPPRERSGGASGPGGARNSAVSVNHADPERGGAEVERAPGSEAAE